MKNYYTCEVRYYLMAGLDVHEGFYHTKEEADSRVDELLAKGFNAYVLY